MAANVSGSPVKDGQAALDIVESCYECVPVLSQGFQTSSDPSFLLLTPKMSVLGLSTRFAKTGLRVGHVFKDGTRRPGGTLVLVPSLLLATPFLTPKLILTFLHFPHSILLLPRAG